MRPGRGQDGALPLGDVVVVAARRAYFNVKKVRFEGLVMLRVVVGEDSRPPLRSLRPLTYISI
jgi:hypothetical protein